jgi:hypothetical protein
MVLWTETTTTIPPAEMGMQSTIAMVMQLPKAMRRATELQKQTR